MPDGVVVFERRIGAARWSALILLALSVPVVLKAVLDRESSILLALDPATQVFGRAPVLGSVIAVSLAPLVLLVVTIVTLSRRFGRCVAGPDWLVFERALLPVWIGRTVALRSELHDRQPRADLVRVWLRGQRKNVPFIVPTSTQAELEAALLELDRVVDLEPVAAGRHHGRRDRWLEAAFVAALYAFAVATMLVVERRLGEHWALPSLFGLMALMLPLGLCASAARAPRIRRVYVGRSGLAVGEELFTWDELTEIGVGDGHLACAAGSRTCLAFIGADEAKVRDAIAMRLAERGRPVEEILGPLPAHVAGWRRRAGTLALGAPALLVPVGVLAAACLVPNYESFRRVGAEDQRLYVIHARDGDRPAIVVLDSRGEGKTLAFRTGGWWPQSVPTRGASETVDLPSGATFVHLSNEGTLASAPEWRDTAEFRGLRATTLVNARVLDVLEALAEGVDDEVVRAAALGWVTRRFFDVHDEATALMWQVDRGVVQYVVHAPRGASFTAFNSKDGPQAFTTDGNGGLAPDPTLPTSHAELLEVRRRVLAGERLADVLRR